MPEQPDFTRIRKEQAAYDAIAIDRQQRNLDAVLESFLGRRLAQKFRASGAVDGFPRPASVWIDSLGSPLSQVASYEWLSPVRNRFFLQLGGSGSHAMKALVAGARQAVLITPVREEAGLALRMARQLRVLDRFQAVIGIGERQPLTDASVDVMYGGGTLHHMELGPAMAEIGRVLKPGGRAAFVDPNLNVLYRALEVTGLRRLGREPGAQCYPLRLRDVRPLVGGFKTGRLHLSGGLLRYAIVGAVRVLRLPVPLSLSMALQRSETWALSRIGLSGQLGSLAVLLEK
ncbi:MAG: methyltransferase domain-containing protein [Chloroflexi bacterium]|nr:methyltransferase domain-containing protein [Chloroflexota bacterium]